MVLHALNNGLMLSLAYWGDSLKTLGFDLQDQQHLPLAWLLGAVVLTGIGLVLTYWGRRPDHLALPAPDTIKPPLAAPPEPRAG